MFDIKSANDVKENDRKMQVKLLEKVEELTLYMLELRAENEKLKKMIISAEN